METVQMCFDLVHFEDFIKRQLKERKMTVAKLAKISGVHPNTIRNYLGRRCEPSLYNVLCIATALGFTVEAIKR